MSEAVLDRRIAAVRRFNRFYTKKIGVLSEAFLNTPYSLTEARVLHALAQRDGATATWLCEELGLDPGYLSRLLRGFEQQKLIFRSPSPQDGRHDPASLVGQRAKRCFGLLLATCSWQTSTFRHAEGVRGRHQPQ